MAQWQAKPSARGTEGGGSEAKKEVVPLSPASNLGRLTKFHLSPEERSSDGGGGAAPPPPSSRVRFGQCVFHTPIRITPLSHSSLLQLNASE